MNKKGMLQEMILHYSGGNKAKFANKLGIRPQTINSWESRETFDAELLYAKCEDISGDWLLSGEGNMLRSKVSSMRISASEQKPRQTMTVENHHNNTVIIGNWDELRDIVREELERSSQKK